MAQKLSIILTPCDLITDIDCSNLASKSKVTSENQRCDSPEKEKLNNCHNTKNDEVIHSTRTTDQKHQGSEDETDKNGLENDLGSPSSGFTPVTFYGSRGQNFTPRTKLFSPSAHKKLRQDSEDLGDSSSGIKRKFKKQSNSATVKKKRKTSNNVRQGKSGGKRSKSSSAVHENGIQVRKSESVVSVDEDNENEGKAKNFEMVINDVDESKEGPEESTCFTELNYGSEGSGIDLASEKSSPNLMKSVASDIDSVCSEASLCSGPGTLLEGLLLRKNGNEYIFSSPVDSDAPKEQLTPSSEDSSKERTTCIGIANGIMISDPPSTSQNKSLVGKMTVAGNHNDDSQSSLTFSMSSPDTSESDFTLKMSDKDADSSSSKSSPEHQASIMRYFRSIPAPKCKTKLIANGVSSSTLPDNPPEAKNRLDVSLCLMGY